MARRLAKTLLLAGVAVASAKDETPLKIRAVALGKPIIANHKVELPVKDGVSDKCTFCGMIGTQAIQTMLNFLVNYGVADSCEILSGLLPENVQSPVDFFCKAAGLLEFLKVLGKVEPYLDTVYFCEELKACPRGRDNVRLTLSKGIAQPFEASIGDGIDLGAILTAYNQTGVATIRIDVAGETETALIPTGFAPGSQAVTTQFDIQNTETFTWDYQEYVFNVTVCQGTCGSPYPGSIDFGTVQGIFRVTRNLKTEVESQALVATSQTKTTGPIVKSKGVLSSQVGEVPICEFCNQLTTQAVNTLVTAVLKYSVPDTCSVLCGNLKGDLVPVCNTLCLVVGLKELVKAMNNFKGVDTIHLCEILHACRVGPADAKIVLQSAIVQPTTVAIGGSIELGAVIDTQVATGVSEVEVTIGGIVETALVPDGFKVGQQAVALTIPVQNTETTKWLPGLTNFSVSICQNACGSKAPHSILFGTVSGQFIVETETAVTQAAVVV